MKNLRKLLGVSDAEVNAEELIKLAAMAELELRKRRDQQVDQQEQEELNVVRQSLLSFTKFTKKDYVPNWHHEVTCRYLDMFARGEINRLMINMPPQHGKSELASKRLPAYLLGFDPNERIIACSHTADFSSQLNREVQRIIDNVLYYQLFPGTTLNRSNVKTNSFGNFIRTSDQFEIVGHDGYYKSAGVGGDITGRTATVLILDDPYKNPEEAWSKTIREKVWNWYWSTFFARRASDKVRVLIIHTRWHEDDISGRLLNSKGSNAWEVLSFPAVAEEPKHKDDIRADGEVLWPERFSKEAILQYKEEAGSYLFSALYQQNPQPAEGGLFKRKDFRYFIERDGYYKLADVENLLVYPMEECSVYMTMDLAVTMKETADYTVLLVFCMTPNNEILIIDIRRERMEGADHIGLIKQMQMLYNPVLIGIEDNQYQKALVQQAHREGLPVKGLRSVKDKFSKAQPIAAKLEAHKIFFKHAAPWVDLFENELLAFPNGAHDDQVDALSFISEIVLMSVAPALSKSNKTTTSRFTQQKQISGF